MKKGCKYGTHRVIEPIGVLPQVAKKIENTMEIYDNEILIDVTTLNIDSASFTQIKDVCNKSVNKMDQMIQEIIAQHGKMQNPVTGSGGMLIGVIKKIGPEFPDKKIKVGDKIATLVSLSLTPLKVNKINKVNIENDQVDIEGQAILFASGIYAKLPQDIPEKLALAVLDVAGAPAQTAKLVKEGDTVCVIGGGGKSGILCSYQAMKSIGKTGKVIVIEYNKYNAQRLIDLHLAHEVITADATKSIDIYEKIQKITDNQLCDIVINNVNIPDTETSSVLITKDNGTLYFFSMATSFTKAALGAEGVGKDLDMLIGNGYTKGHADLAINIMRESKSIRELFEKLYL